jgi:hypothetical protein
MGTPSPLASNGKVKRLFSFLELKDTVILEYFNLLTLSFETKGLGVPVTS